MEDAAAEILSFHGWQPTPSAQAMETFWAIYPWVPPIYKFEGVRAYKYPNSAGLYDCRKCNSCRLARANDIRRAYDEDYDEALAFEDDSD